MVLLLAVCASGALAAQESGGAEEGDYVIYFGNMPAGVSHFKVTESDTGGGPRTTISTETVTSTKVRNRGSIDFVQKLETVIDGKTQKLISYHIQSKSPFKTEDTLIEFSAEKAKVLRKTGGTTVERYLKYSEIPSILDIRNPGGGNWNLPLLAWTLKQSGLCGKDRMELDGIYSGLFLTFHLSLEKVEVPSTEPSPYLCYEVQEKSEGVKVTHRLFIEPQSGKVVRMESPSENFSYVRENARKIHTPPELFGASVIPLTSDLRNCGYVKARVKMMILQEELSDKDLKVAGQSFQGSFKDGILEGTALVRSSHFKTIGSPEYPCEFTGDMLKKYLEPEFLAESDDEAIKSQASNLVKGAKTVKDAVSLLGSWVYQNIQFDYTDGSAKAALLSKKGDWLPRIRLFIAMCRSIGIPARYAGGFLLNENIAGRYIWAEVYMGEASGWIPVDPAMGQIEYFSANHITLWRNGFIDPYHLKPELQVQSYEEEERPKGTKLVVP